MRWIWRVWIELKIGMENDVMCVVSEGLGGTMEMLD